MTALALVVATCSSGEAAVEGSRLQIVQADRGNQRIRAEAIGTVEPVRTVEIKSEASGGGALFPCVLGGMIGVGAALAFPAGVGLLFGIWPARRAAMLDPIDALRYE